MTVAQLLSSNRLLMACEQVLLDQSEQIKAKQHEADVISRHERLLGG